MDFNFLIILLIIVVEAILIFSVKNNFHIIGDEDYSPSIWMLVVSAAMAAFLLAVILLAFLCIKIV